METTPQMRIELRRISPRGYVMELHIFPIINLTMKVFPIDRHHE